MPSKPSIPWFFSLSTKISHGRGCLSAWYSLHHMGIFHRNARTFTRSHRNKKRTIRNDCAGKPTKIMANTAIKRVHRVCFLQLPSLVLKWSFILKSVGPPLLTGIRRRPKPSYFPKVGEEAKGGPSLGSSFLLVLRDGFLLYLFPVLLALLLNQLRPRKK